MIKLCWLLIIWTLYKWRFSPYTHPPFEQRGKLLRFKVQFSIQVRLMAWRINYFDNNYYTYWPGNFSDTTYFSEEIFLHFFYLAWKTLPNAPSPISLTYSILFLGYSRLSNLGFRRSGILWYMGLGCSLSSRSSDGRVVRVTAADSLQDKARSVRSSGSGEIFILRLMF